MSQVVIENPVINSPYTEPNRHFQFNDEGITNQIAEGRRPSSYFVPIARPRGRGAQPELFDTQWIEERIKENDLINTIRQRVGVWRKGGPPADAGNVVLAVTQGQQNGQLRFVGEQLVERRQLIELRVLFHDVSII